jgi:hypothetical protein
MQCIAITGHHLNTLPRIDAAKIIAPLYDPQTGAIGLPDDRST